MTIDGTKYKYNACFSKYFSDTELGSTGTFLLDQYGRVCAFLNNVPTAKYGYVLGYKTEKAMDLKVNLKILTEEDEIKGYTLADYVTIDGKRYRVKRDLDLISNLFASGDTVRRQPVIYQLNSDGKIGLLDTYIAADPKNIDPNVTDTFDRLKLYYEDSTIYYTTSARGPYERTYTVGQGAVVFVVPRRIKSAPAAEYADEQFRCTSGSELNENTNRTFDVFDLDEVGNAGMVVLYDDNSGSKPFSVNLPMGVCDTMMETYDAETGDVRKEVYFWYNGSFQRKFLTDDVTEIPQTGDLFQYRTDAQGEIEKIVLQYRSDGSINKTSITSESFRIVEPERIVNNYLCGITNNEFFSYYNMVNTKFVVFNTATGALQSGTIDDIEIGKCKCIVPLQSFNAVSCVIYK